MVKLGKGENSAIIYVENKEEGYDTKKENNNNKKKLPSE